MQFEMFNPRVVLENEEIAVTFGGREVWRLSWLDVEELAVWKDETAAEQPLCFGLRSRSMPPGEYLGVSDLASGFEEALEEIDRRFDGAYSIRWKEAVFPPMATQWACVFGTASGRPEHAKVLWPEAA